MMKQKGSFSAFIIRLSIVATGLSVAVMIVAVATVNGFKHTIQEKMYGMLGHIHIELYNADNTESLNLSAVKWDTQLENKIRQLPHVQQVSVFAAKPAIIKTKDEMEGLQLMGITADHHFSKGITFTGNAIDFSDSAYAKQVVLSESTADRLNVKQGDMVEMIFADPGGEYPRIRNLRVAGLFHTGVEEMDKYYAICDLRLVQRINNWQADDINGYQVDLDDAKYADSTSTNIFKNYLQPPLNSYTLKQIAPNIFDWLALQDTTGAIILFIMAIVAIINLASALMILIVDHARMVGMMKTLGMEPAKLRQVFLYYSALIAGAGVLFGNLFGVGVCVLQEKFKFIKLSEKNYYMKYAPIHYNWGQIGLIDIATLIVCILCMWLPTLYIRYIQPAKVLQFK